MRRHAVDRPTSFSLYLHSLAASASSLASDDTSAASNLCPAE